MALINCPECGKEISDKATACPNCGCPVTGKEDNKVEDSNVEDNAVIAKGVNKIPIKTLIIGIIIFFLLVIGIIIGVVIPKQKKAKVEGTYKEAKELIEDGKYSKAYELLETIPDYEKTADLVAECQKAEEQSIFDEAISNLEAGKYDEAVEMLKSIPKYERTREVLEQAKYESYALSAVKELKGILKNPDSLSVYDVNFYFPKIENKDESSESDSQEKHPGIVFYYGAQNGFGGNTASYAAFSYDEEKKEYEFFGSINSLDKDDLDTDDDDYVYKALTLVYITALKSGEEVGSIDMERFNKLVKSSSYMYVKIIE